jgi:hypothetical protein
VSELPKPPTDWAAIIVALSVLVSAVTAAYVSLRRRVDGVHTLVNSQLTEIKAALAAAVSKRDEAIVQRDEARRERNSSQEGAQDA